jgi:predicted O-methyltransferase YrrM
VSHYFAPFRRDGRTQGTKAAPRKAIDVQHRPAAGTAANNSTETSRRLSGDAALHSAHTGSRMRAARDGRALLYCRVVEFTQAAAIVESLPQPRTSPVRGRVLYDHIRTHRPERVLEMGTCRGASAVFIAAALQENGVGHLVSVDSLKYSWTDPTPQETLARAGLDNLVTLDRRFSTYTWFLKDEIQLATVTDAVSPRYDLIFLDGAKNWSTDGLAVLLAEKLLRPGGWLLLDDLGWTYESFVKDKKVHYEIDVAKLSEPERTQPHLRAVFDLLVRTHPAFDRCHDDGWWGWAHKAPQAGPTPSWWRRTRRATRSRAVAMLPGLARRVRARRRRRARAAA